MNQSIKMNNNMLPKLLFLLFTVLLQHNYIKTMEIDQIVQHKKIQSQKKQFPCTTCNKSYAKQKDLIAHERIHSEKNLHSCTICPKRFIYESCLKAHLLSHSGEKPHKCITCNKTFPTKSNLKRHQQSHSPQKTSAPKIKSYHCTKCTKSFFQQCHLTEHILRKHSERKPYHCTTCDKGFVRKSYLINHEQQHSSEKPYTLTKHKQTHSTQKESVIVATVSIYQPIEPLFENNDIHVS